MNNTADENTLQPTYTYYLSDLVGSTIYSTYDIDKRMGKLADVVIIEKGSVPHVTDLVISRPRGLPSLLIPISHVQEIERKRVVVSIDSVNRYEQRPAEDALLLNDFIINKKVIDIEDRDVSIVYDVKIIEIMEKLYVSDVLVNRYGLLKRLGLLGIAKWLGIEEELVSWKGIQPLPEHITGFKGNVKLRTLRENIADIPPVDMADILEELSQEQRTFLFSEMEPIHASDTLEEIDPNVQRELVESLDKRVIALMIDEMTPAQAADVVSALSFADKQVLMTMINSDLAKKIEHLIENQEDGVMPYMTDRYVRFSIQDSVGDVRDRYEPEARSKEIRHYLYVTDDENVLSGIVDIADILVNRREILLKDIMTTNFFSLTTGNTLKDAWEIFARYGFRAIPVIDSDRKLMGVVLYKDVMNLKHRFVS